MKKIFVSLFACAAVTLFTACDSALEYYPLDNPSAETFFTNETEIQGGVNACYNYVGEAGTSYLNFEYSWDGLSDLVFLRGCAFSQNLLTGALDYKEGFFRTLWLRMYQGVGRCNLMLQKIEENGDKISEAQKRQMRGEVLFLRGYYYGRLIDMFGDVVYTEEPISSPAEGMQVERSPKSEVLQHVYADLDEAAKLLDGSTVNELGRANKYTALAYKSRYALFNNDWSAAATAAKAIIDSKQFELYPSYGELFTEDAVLSANNKEQIFTRSHLILAGNTTPYVRDAGCRSIGGWSTIVPTQNLVDSYECIDGQHIDKSPLYDKLNPYENRDPRMRATLVLPGDMWCGYIFDTRKDKPNTLNEAGEMVKNPESYNTTEFTTFTGYLLRKYYELKYKGSSGRCEIPFMLCRYAEILLNYAEAKVEQNLIDASCLEAINLIRQRAGMPDIPSGLSQQEMRAAIQYERKVELANEGLRRSDLNRWKRSEVVLNRPIFGRPVLGEYDVYPSVSFDEYGDPVYAHESYTPHPSTDYRILIRASFDKSRDYLWPIPETELNLNPNLGQNPNW